MARHALQIDLALRAARNETKRPSLILVRTHLGYGSPNKQDTFEAHGSPLGVDEVRLTKQNLGWPLEPLFDIPPEALAHFRHAVPQGQKLEAEWQGLFGQYSAQYPGLAMELKQRLSGELPTGWVPLTHPCIFARVQSSVSLPHGNLSASEPRAAFSHSASVGSRSCRHAQYDSTSSRFTHTTG